MNINITLEVELTSGAKVHLTEAQLEEARKALVTIISGEPAKVEKRGRKPRRRTRNEWTDEQEARLNAIMEYTAPYSAARRVQMQRFVKETGHTLASVYTHKARRPQKEAVAVAE